jgi:ABC-type lipoprotein release transport system permease subunit
LGVPITYNIRNLRERKATTIMTAFGIALTVAVLVMSLALSAGLRQVFAATGDPRQALILRKGTDAELTSSITTETYQIVRQLPIISKTSEGEPMVSPEALTVVNLPSVDSPDGMNVTVRGLTPIGLLMHPNTITQGVMFTPGLREIVVGESIEKRYPNARIGNELRFGRGMWKIVGVFSAGGTASDSEIWADLNQLRGDFERQGGSSSLLVRLDSPDQIEPLKKLIEDDRRLGSTVMGEKAYYENLTQAGLPLQILGFAVAVIMAIGSAFAATNTMYAAVARRAREIGTLRALGFGRGSILISFMLESVVLCLLGGLLGVLIALPINGLTTGVGSFATFSETAFKLKIDSTSIVAGLLFSVVIGAIGGLLPAWAASRKNIVAAMRDL